MRHRDFSVSVLSVDKIESDNGDAGRGDIKEEKKELTNK